MQASHGERRLHYGTSVSGRQGILRRGGGEGEREREKERKDTASYLKQSNIPSLCEFDMGDMRPLLGVWICGSFLRP